MLPTNPNSPAYRYGRFIGSLLPGLALLLASILTIALVAERLAGALGTTIGIAAGIGLAFGCLLGYWNGVDWWNLRLLRRQQASGNTTPEDGSVFAFSGDVTVDGDPLVSPITEQACAAYTYEIAVSRSSSGRSGRSSHSIIAQGFHLVPTRIVNARAALKLGSLPGMEDDLRESDYSEKWAARVRLLVERLQTTASAAGDAQRFSSLLEARHALVEEVHEDYCQVAGELKGNRFSVEEEVLPVNVTVVAIGTYDAQRQALTPRNSRIGPNLMIYLGSPEEVLARVGKDVALYWRIVKFTLGFAAGALAFVLLPAAWTSAIPLLGLLVIPR